MSYRLAIFDLDGTILDTLEDLKESTNAALAANGYPERTLEEVRCFVGNGIGKLIERAVPKGTSKEATKKTLESFKVHYGIHCADHTKPYDGIIKLLEDLRKYGIQTAVVSNKADFAVQELCSQYFPKAFDFVVGEREGIRRKPCPDSVFEVLKTLKKTAAEAVYIGDSDVDVDTAKDLLIGKTIYIQSETVRVDDANSYSGYRDIPISVNTEATVTAVGVGSQAYPVKIIFKDTQGHSYYLEVALSRTNSGMDMSDFQGEKRMKYFSNSISFTNKKLDNIESLKNRYLGATVYPKKTLSAKRAVSLENKQMESRVHLPRYTILTIKEVRMPSPGSLAILTLKDKNGISYEMKVDLKYDVITRNNNYIEDLFGFEDIHKKYPGITEKRWQIISRGDLEVGMSTDECRLSIGDPIEIVLKKDNRFENWFYNGKTLEFESGTLQRFK